MDLKGRLITLQGRDEITFARNLLNIYFRPTPGTKSLFLGPLHNELNAVNDTPSDHDEIPISEWSDLSLAGLYNMFSENPGMLRQWARRKLTATPDLLQSLHENKEMGQLEIVDEMEMRLTAMNDRIQELYFQRLDSEGY